MKDDEILKLYLLGSLDEEQADDLELRLLRESELFELAEAMEGDLLMAAARGDLSPAERGRVLRRLASSPEGRARYALIRQITEYGREPVPAEVRVLEWLSQPKLRAAAAAAGMAFVAGCFWLAIVLAPGDRVSHRMPPPPLPTSSPSPAAPPGDEIAERSPVPAPPISPESRVAPGREPSVPPEPAPLILQLALTTTRSAGGAPPRLELGPGTRRVEIRLPLIPDEPYSSFTAILWNASIGEEIRREEQLKAREVEGRRMVVLSVPAADLAPGFYEGEVRGMTNEEDELLGRPTFEVVSN